MVGKAGVGSPPCSRKWRSITQAIAASVTPGRIAATAAAYAPSVRAAARRIAADLARVFDHARPLHEAPERDERHIGQRLDQFGVPVPREVRLKPDLSIPRPPDVRRHGIHDAVREWRGHGDNLCVSHVPRRFPRAHRGTEQRRLPLCGGDHPPRRFIHLVVFVAEACEVAAVAPRARRAGHPPHSHESGRRAV